MKKIPIISNQHKIDK